MGKEQRISFRKEKKVWEALASLYQRFKDTAMTLGEYEEKREELERPLATIERRFSSLLSLTRALLGETNKSKEWPEEKVTHEGIHERIAIAAAAEMGMEKLTIEFSYTPRCDRILWVGPTMNTAPTTAIIFPNLATEAGSKERYIEFLDKAAKHPDPSRVDKLFK